MLQPAVPVWKKVALTAAVFLPALGLVMGLRQVNQLQQYVSFAAPESAHLAVDITRSAGSLSRPWSNLGQGGENSTFSLKPFAAALSELQPRYFRIDHLYDYYIKVDRNSAGLLTFDFTRLDALLQEMKSAGITPFISLSYMPSVLSADITGAPASWTDYQHLIQTTIEHISGKSGLDLPGVYYEVWNEPDLFGAWKTYGDKNYLTLYTYAAQAADVAAGVEAFKFGGPATTHLYSNWMIALMTLVTSQNLRLDFISWHHYTLNPEEYRQDTTDLKIMMANFVDKAKTLEVILSEWGPNSENDPAYDNAVSAAHLVASTVEMIPVVDKAFVFELEDGKSPQNIEFWGRWGLYTYRDFGPHAKPRAEALKLLNQLGPDRLALTGNGTFVKAMAAKKDQTVQILVANYDYAHKHTENVPLTLTGLTPGSYQLTKTFLSQSKYSQTIEIPNPTYQTSIPLAPNVVVLLELTPAP